ncbi:MAG: flavodoxin family protein [Candidatus Bipolaricaulota bacterium]
MAKALAICGSPRAGSNTEAYLKAALGVLADHGVATELVLLRGKRIQSCRACYACWRPGAGVCQIQDDDFPEIRDKMLAADALIVGSPVHYSAVHADLWSVLVRAGFPGMAGHPNSPPRPFARKIGGPITVARRAGQNMALAQLLLWFNINGFVVPGSIYWPIGVARSVGDAEKDTEGMRTAEQFAENVAWLLRKTLEEPGFEEAESKGEA